MVNQFYLFKSKLFIILQELQSNRKFTTWCLWWCRANSLGKHQLLTITHPRIHNIIQNKYEMIFIFFHTTLSKTWSYHLFHILKLSHPLGWLKFSCCDNELKELIAIKTDWQAKKKKRSYFKYLYWLKHGKVQRQEKWEALCQWKGKLKLTQGLGEIIAQVRVITICR